MTREDVDALFLRATKALPAKPDWREGTQAGTRRAYMPVTLDGAPTGLRIALTARLSDAAYLTINLLAGRSCIARLCMTGGHRDRLTRLTVVGAHYHRWQDNRPTGSKIAKVPQLRHQVTLPATTKTRDAALTLFLSDCGIALPHWWPMVWPIEQVLL